MTLDYHVGIFVDGQWINDGFYEGVPALGVCANNWRPTPFGILKYLDESSAMIPERYYSKTDWIVPQHVVRDDVQRLFVQNARAGAQTAEYRNQYDMDFFHGCSGIKGKCSGRS